jgi:hypothetical protein
MNNNNILANVPVIENIHQKVFEAATVPPEALDMGQWHSSCGTTHCRAGWVVHLAGKLGYELEKATSTPHAAMMIYHASNPGIPVSSVRFYENKEEAIEDMKRCAELEKNQTK